MYHYLRLSTHPLILVIMRCYLPYIPHYHRPHASNHYAEMCPGFAQLGNTLHLRVYVTTTKALFTGDAHSIYCLTPLRLQALQLRY